jgi:hypothetical protein
VTLKPIGARWSEFKYFFVQLELSQASRKAVIKFNIMASTAVGC